VLRTYADVRKLRSTWTASFERGGYRERNRKVIAFKWSRADGTSVYMKKATPMLHHAVGAHFLVKAPNYNLRESCGAGVNVASADWVARETKRRSFSFSFSFSFSYDVAIWQIEFTIWDIVAIPFGTDGKMRVDCAAITHKVTRNKLLRIKNGAEPLKVKAS
jgi:hypothetical protein